MNQAVIVAGGMGQRMSSVLSETPKLLTPVWGRTIVDYQIQSLKSNGVTSFHFCLGMYSEQIVNYLSLNYKDLDFTYSVEQKPLGTYGALLNSIEYLNDEFILIFGDILFNVNLRNSLKKFSRNNIDVLLITRYTEHPDDSDIIIDENSRVIDIRKGNNLKKPYLPIGNTGIFLINKKGLDKNYNQEKLDLTTHFLVPKINKLNIYHKLTIGFIRDIGTPKRLNSIKNKFNVFQDMKLIFVDRDDTIIKNLGDSNMWKELEFTEGAIDFIKYVQQKNYKLILMTNQPGIAKGFFSTKELKITHAQLQTKLIDNGCAPLNLIYFCPHHPKKGFKNEVKKLKVHCECRKPKTGMFDQFKEEQSVDLKNYYYIGNEFSDKKFGENIGAKTFIVNNSELNESVTFDQIRKNL